jgi:uncharacterized protein YhbP (UPF0306 family)
MDPKQLAKEYVKQFNVMQLATAEDNDPWICTVHFYADDELNFYWVSSTDRHHSRHIAKNPLASATFVVHENTPEEGYVISVTASGKAEVVTDVADEIRKAYIAKLHKPANLLPDSDDSANLQKFYRLKPDSIIVFDTKNFPKNPRQEFSLTA